MMVHFLAERYEVVNIFYGRLKLWSERRRAALRVDREHVTTGGPGTIPSRGGVKRSASRGMGESKDECHLGRPP